MDTNTPIGLNAEAAAQLSSGLNDLLADLTVFYMNARGFHWNIRGKAFFELHAKFEELYTDLQLKIDEVAERVLTLGSHPTHTHEEYPFALERGVTQGDPISALLFICGMEAMFRTLLRWSRLKRRKKRRYYGLVVDDPQDPLTNLRFADDVLLVASSSTDIAKMVADLKAGYRPRPAAPL